ncbi:hypothetical protein G3I60_30215 [Streptomyces sp. SID13666]|uniref:hypothetical protein n=1 Tax=unclassified Streptomyces TaxID=2593676 RepID=UPI0013BFBC4D|nr:MULTISPECIES: hypothetical protein [unclassified Streptomyces]NEA58315.1 hypothetical protein [Streptomyces sp. SID13666]NEA76557.1 hypothetical protein [Streptomyces sp. SID13588]
MKRPVPTADTVRAAMDTVLSEAAASGTRPTIAAVERRLGLTHATFYRHFQHLVTDYFQPRIADRAATTDVSAPAGGSADNLRRLRQENADLRKTLQLYEEAIRQLALENDALRNNATVTALPRRGRSGSTGVPL